MIDDDREGPEQSGDQRLRELGVKPVAGIERQVIDITGMNVTLNGVFDYNSAIEDLFMPKQFCVCPPGLKYHAINCQNYPGQEQGHESIPTSTTRDAAGTFMTQVGLDATPDAIDQLVEVFIPCLRLMCERGYDPNGKTWQKSGRFGAMHDVRMKFERLWERVWVRGIDPGDSGVDAINYIGFLLRSKHERWGEWGEHATPAGDSGNDA